MIRCSTTSYERTQFEKKLALRNCKAKTRDNITMWKKNQLWKKTQIANCNAKVRHHAKKYKRTQLWEETDTTNHDMKKFMFFLTIKKHNQQIKLKTRTLVERNLLSINHYNKTAISSIIFARQYIKQIAISKTATLWKRHTKFCKTTIHNEIFAKLFWKFKIRWDVLAITKSK